AHKPRVGDALCFYLGKPGELPLRIGREVGNEIVLNDATVSRIHLALLPSTAGGWMAKPAGGKVTRFDGASFEGDEAVALKSGAQLELGQVKLTFHDA